LQAADIWEMSRTRKGKTGGMAKTTPPLKLQREKNTKVVSVLERFIVNPALTRHELRVKLGVLDELAAEVFALMVFLCDDLFHLKPASNPTVTPNRTSATTRFFVIVKCLPIELQMILCHRAVGSTKQNILLKDSEAIFKSLARILLLRFFFFLLSLKV